MFKFLILFFCAHVLCSAVLILWKMYRPGNEYDAPEDLDPGIDGGEDEPETGLLGLFEIGEGLEEVEPELTEKERKKIHDQAQAERAVEFFTWKVHTITEECKDTEDEIADLERRIRIASAQRQTKEETKCRKEIEKLERKLKSNSDKLYAARKRLYDAQFKAESFC